MKTKRKNIFKSLLALTLVLIMVLGAAPLSELAGVDLASLFAPKAEAATYGIYTYEVDEDATITITGCNKSANGAITIPSKIDGKPVTRIGDGAFEDCTGLTSVTLGNSVTSIGDVAFYDCSGLTSITIPDSVTSIGDSAFLECTGLTSITIPNSVTSIGAGTFNGCSSLTSITIPDSVTSIGNGAFEDCTGLTSITIPNSVESIGHDAFLGCTGLTSINVARGNNYYSGNNGVLFNKKKTELIRYPEGKSQTSYTIPNSVTSIEDAAFDGCTGLTSITIPNSVTSIGVRAFRGCTGLTSITLGNSVTSIGEMAFSCCTGLTSITILDSVTSIGACAFADCTGLTSITIPDSVTSIGYGTFDGCTGLTSITIPNSVTSIEDAAFDGCASLKDVYYTGSKDEWKAISIGEYNGCLLNATIHYNWTGEHVCTNKKLVTVPAQCEVNGMSYYICTECGKQIGEATIIPATGHSWGEWHVTKDATATTEGSRERECAACGKKETEIIPILAQTAKDDKSGIEVSAPSGSYNGELELEVEEIFDGESFQIVGTIEGQEQSKIYDVTTKVDGKEAQPGATVTVKIPLPEGYDPARTYVYHVNSETGKVENMNARYEDGFLVFETDHFSTYAVVQIKAQKKDSFFKKILNIILAPFRAIINLFKKLFGK